MLFEQIELTWKGKRYVIPPSRVLKAIAKVEDIITLNQLSAPEALPLAKLSEAYAALLRYAGAFDVTGDDVYAALWDPLHGVAQISAVTSGLLAMMMPPSILKKINTLETKPTPEAQQKDQVGNVEPTKV